MSAKKVFISHSDKDDDVVAKIREALESLGLGAWTDSRQLTGGDELEPDILKAIDDARHLVAVLSLNAVNSCWVLKEIQYALEVKKKRTDGFKVVPLLLDGIEPAALRLWFHEEPAAIKIRRGPDVSATRFPSYWPPWACNFRTTGSRPRNGKPPRSRN